MSFDTSTLQRWFSRRAPARAQSDDPAEMGTCFGLELSFADTVPVVAPAPPALAPGPWWRRRPPARPKPS
jgi:hypothetical protein